MTEWTHNICESCFFRSEEGAHPDGGFRLPVRMTEPPPGVCCGCGSPTVSGIYVRKRETELLCRGNHLHPEEWSPLIRDAANPTSP